MSEFNAVQAIEELDKSVVSLLEDKWEVMNQVGEHYRQRRVDAGLTNAQIGEVMNRSRSFISDLELGRRTWNVENAKLYEAALDQLIRAGKAKKSESN